MGVKEWWGEGVEGEGRRGVERRGEVPVYMTTNGESRHQLSLAYVSPILSLCAVALVCACHCVIPAWPRLVSITQQTLTLCSRAGKRAHGGERCTERRRAPAEGKRSVMRCRRRQRDVFCHCVFRFFFNVLGMPIVNSYDK